MVIEKTAEGSTVLGLARGTRIPQLVIHEYVRTRAGRNCEGFLVSADLQAPQSPTKRRYRQTPLITEDHQELLGKLEQLCRIEWGEFPKPVSVGLEGGQWIIHFRNHAEDRNPATIVIGDFNRLLVRGRNSFDLDFANCRME